MRSKFEIWRLISKKIKAEIKKVPFWVFLGSLVAFLNGAYTLWNNFQEHRLSISVEIRSITPYLRSTSVNSEELLLGVLLDDDVKQNSILRELPDIKVFAIPVTIRIKNQRKEPMTFSDFKLHLLLENSLSLVSEKYMMSESRFEKGLDLPVSISEKEIKDFTIDFIFLPLKHLELAEFAGGKPLTVTSYFVTFKDELGRIRQSKKYKRFF